MIGALRVWIFLGLTILFEGGGVAVYVKSNIRFKRRWDLKMVMDSLELIWLEVMT